MESKPIRHLKAEPGLCSPIRRPSRDRMHRSIRTGCAINRGFCDLDENHAQFNFHRSAIHDRIWLGFLLIDGSGALLRFAIGAMRRRNHGKRSMKTTAANVRMPTIGFFFALGLLFAGQAHAEVVYNVNSAVDQVDDDVTDGVCHTTANGCTLRAAIMQSNYLSGSFTVRIKVPAGNYALNPPVGADGEASGDLNLDAPLSPGLITVIEGASAATTVIDANQLDRVMSIAVNRKVTLSNLTIRGGNSSDGGGIRSYGPLTLLDSIVENNAGGTAGGIFGVYMNIQRCIFRYNSGYSGGALSFGYSPDASVVQDSSFHHNTAFDGGAILNLPGAGVEIINSTITDNSAGEMGGGIDNRAKLLLVNSTISRNTATYSGGGITNFQATILATRSTISANAAGNDGGGLNNAGIAVFVNSTISGNAAGNNGGGIANLLQTSLYSTSIVANDSDHNRDENGGAGGGVYSGDGNRLISVNTLIANNTTLDSPIADDCYGVLEVYGWNLLSDYSGCSFSGNGVAARGLVSTNTIGPLANNGGATWTHALLAGSEAIDTTTAQGCVDNTLALLTTDQRGAPRIAGSKCDVGAFEYGSAVPPTDVIYRNGFD